MLTVIVNTFKNTDKKFQKDPMKIIGDMYIYFSGTYFC